MAEADLKGVATGGGGGGNSTIINTAANPVVIRPLDCSTDHPDICDRVGRQLGVVSLSGGAVDVSDRCSRLLGTLCSSGVPIDPRAIRALTCSDLITLCSGGVPIDPRIIRFLAFATDKVDVSGSTVTIGAITSITQFTPISKSTIHNTALPAAGADLLGASLAPTNTPTFFRITCAFTIAGQLTVDIINGGNEQRMFLNGGSDLSPSVIYTFEVPIHAGDTMNLEYSTTGGTIQVIRVQEIDASTA